MYTKINSPFTLLAMIFFPIKITYRSFVLLLSASLLVSCYSSAEDNESSGDQNSPNIPAVEAVQARYGSLPLSERLSGTVIAQNQVLLYPEISGKIAEVHVQTGEPVKRGAPLVSLQNQQYSEQVQQADADVNINRARLKQAKARRNQMEAQYTRTRQLSNQELSSDLEMETLQAQMASAEADVELAEAQLKQSQSNLQEQKEVLSRTVIRAPISGTVGQRNAQVGMQVNTNTQLFTIGNLDNLRIEVVLTDDMLDDVKIGQTALIYTKPQNDSTNHIIEAELSRISPFLNNVTRSTEGEIDVQNERDLLRPGMFVPVDILYGESRQATLVPTSAIYSDPTTGEEGVYVATALGTEIEPIKQVDPDNPPPLTEATQVEFKQVDIIGRGRMQAAVSNIKSGSWVVTVGQNLLSQGRGQARVRTVDWDRILTMQGLQRQDLLQKVMDQQTAQKQSASPS